MAGVASAIAVTSEPLSAWASTDSAALTLEDLLAPYLTVFAKVGVPLVSIDASTVAALLRTESAQMNASLRNRAADAQSAYANSFQVLKPSASDTYGTTSRLNSALKTSAAADPSSDASLLSIGAALLLLFATPVGADVDTGALARGGFPQSTSQTVPKRFFDPNV